jgi:hypothetical protein
LGAPLIVAGIVHSQLEQPQVEQYHLTHRWQHSNQPFNVSDYSSDWIVTQNDTAVKCWRKK